MLKGTAVNYFQAAYGTLNLLLHCYDEPHLPERVLVMAASNSGIGALDLLFGRDHNLQASYMALKAAAKNRIQHLIKG